jgi:hypothetical protein
MKLSICSKLPDKQIELLEFTHSFLLYDYIREPAIVGVEYIFNNAGRVFTLARQKDRDFYDIIERSAILTTIPRHLLLMPHCIYHVPFLFKGVPKVIQGVSSIIAADGFNSPFFVAFRSENNNQWETYIRGEPQLKPEKFAEKLRQCIQTDQHKTPYQNIY